MKIFDFATATIYYARLIPSMGLLFCYVHTCTQNIEPAFLTYIQAKIEEVKPLRERERERGRK